MRKKTSEVLSEVERYEFARRLEQVMAEKEKSYADLAKEAGVTRQAIGQYINGTALPSIPALRKMAIFLGVSVDWLLWIPDAVQYPNTEQPQQILKLESRLDKIESLAHAILTIGRGLND